MSGELDLNETSDEGTLLAVREEIWAQHLAVTHQAKQPMPDGWGITRAKAILALVPKRTVRCCVTCGAVVTEGTTRMHNQWHRELTADIANDQLRVPCPMGCGRISEDPYGGPCKSCWAVLNV